MNAPRDHGADLPPYARRDVISWHRTEHGVRAVVVVWYRDRFTRVRQTLRTYPARSVSGAWAQLMVHGHIDARTWANPDALRAFTMLGEARP